jgi:hypothetical protein
MPEADAVLDGTPGAAETSVPGAAGAAVTAAGGQTGTGEPAPEAGSPEGGPPEGGAAPEWTPEAWQEYQNLRTVVGRQGQELGQLRPVAQQFEQMLRTLAAQQSQQPQKTEAELRQEALRPFAEEAYADLCEGIEDKVALAALQAEVAGKEDFDADAYRTRLQQQAANRAWEKAGREYDRRERERQELRADYDHRLQETVAPIRFQTNLQRAVQAAGAADVTDADLEAVVAETYDLPPEQARAQLYSLDERTLRLVTRAARDRKAQAVAASPATRTAAPAPPPRPPANPAPLGGPKTESTQPAPDAALEQAKARVRQAYPALAGDEARLERAARRILEAR